MNTITAGAERTSINDEPMTRQLRRSASDRMLGGVAGGLARYLNADVTLVRVVTAVLALCTGVGAAAYLAAWLLLPEDGKAQSIAATWIADRKSQSL
jgi:phage shock protein PspC (stress-responsive transcriptional regulator)